ncbi:MAG TPA: DUF1289 domain-containing protein [Hyphomicrobiaceae bacterium]|nr:DUF1289 domain-containing protein [Hyphomicrobiaceae bacterium]
MKSPCRDICTMDQETGLCSGCARTLEEIMAWASLSDSERERIMSLLPERMRKAGLSETQVTLEK